MIETITLTLQILRGVCIVLLIANLIYLGVLSLEIAILDNLEKNKNE